MEQYISATKEQNIAFFNLPIEEPLLMLNLLKFKDKVEDASISGKEQYKLYMNAARPFFIEANAEIVFYGSPLFTLIGPNENEWDKVLIVKYKNKMDFMQMVSNKDYPAAIRNKALEDSRLVFCSSIL